jgi:hypothetical protein
MKICIHQYAFIATILCITTALYPQKTTKQPVSEGTIRILIDKANMIETELKDLLQHYKTTLTQKEKASTYSYKDKQRTPKERNTIRALQDGTQKDIDNLHSKITAIKNHLEITLKQLEAAISNSRKRIYQHITNFSELSDL